MLLIQKNRRILNESNPLITGQTKQGVNTMALHQPTDLKFDSNDKLIASDDVKYRVQKFELYVITANQLDPSHVFYA